MGNGNELNESNWRYELMQELIDDEKRYEAQEMRSEMFFDDEDEYEEDE